MERVWILDGLHSASRRRRGPNACPEAASANSEAAGGRKAGPRFSDHRDAWITPSEVGENPGVEPYMNLQIRCPKKPREMGSTRRVSGHLPAPYRRGRP